MTWSHALVLGDAFQPGAVLQLDPAAIRADQPAPDQRVEPAADHLSGAADAARQIGLRGGDHPLVVGAGQGDLESGVRCKGALDGPGNRQCDGFLFRTAAPDNPHVAPAVAVKATEEGIARVPLQDVETYRQSLQARFEASYTLMHSVTVRAQRQPKQLVLPQGPDPRILRAAGRLVEILPDYEQTDLALYAVYPQARHQSPKVQAFVDFLLEKIGQTAFLVGDGQPADIRAGG